MLDNVKLISVDYKCVISFNEGGVKAVRLLTNKETGRSRGCAYVEFNDSRSHKAGTSSSIDSMESEV